MAYKNLEMNRPVAEAGLAELNVIGNFTDCEIALEGNLLWGATFVSFDKQAVNLLQAQVKQAFIS
jgi:hypothetical protein